MGIVVKPLPRSPPKCGDPVASSRPKATRESLNDMSITGKGKTMTTWKQYMKPTILELPRICSEIQFISKAHGDPQNGGSQPVDRRASKNQVETNFQPRKRIPILLTLAVVKIRAVSRVPIKYRWVITTITCHSLFRQPSLLSQATGDNIRGI